VPIEVDPANVWVPVADVLLDLLGVEPVGRLCQVLVEVLGGDAGGDELDGQGLLVLVRDVALEVDRPGRVHVPA
jgi:hypothetical protein